MNNARSFFLLLTLLIAALPATAQRQNKPDVPATTDKSNKSDTTALVAMMQYIEQTNTVTLDDAALGQTPDTLIGTLVRTGTMGLNYCNPIAIHSGVLRLQLDLGSDYDFGVHPFTASVQLKVEGVDTDPGGGTLATYNPITLAIDQNAPEQVYRVVLSGTALTNHDLIDEYRITILNGYSVTGGVNNSVRVTMRYDDEFAVSATDPADTLPLVEPDFVYGHNGWTEHKKPLFLWNIRSGCADSFPSYQVQVLRLYNIEESYENDPRLLKAVVDWSQAVTYETGNSKKELKTHLEQGTGWYAWRVRPIGSTYPGGSADGRNWGRWSRHPATDSVHVITNYNSYPTVDKNIFYYVQFEDSLNWVYGRTQSEGAEGTRIGEGITFFSPLGIAKQSQVHSMGTDGTPFLTTQSATDFTGRPSVSTMPAPVWSENNGIAYRRKFFSKNGVPFSADNFDDNSTLRDPDGITGGYGRLNYYYDGQLQWHGASLPDADGYPYGRAISATDGSGRLQEIGGPGDVYRIGGGGSGQERTTKIRYGSVSDKELVRLFGDEAPADTMAYKILVTDPNKVTSVQYISEGHVIATGLHYEQGDTLLLALDHSSEPRLNGTIVDTLRGNRSWTGRGSSSNKRYAFADTTTLTIKYSLTPDTVSTEELCVEKCATCDYTVRLYLHNLEVPDSTKVFVYQFGAEHCDTIPTLNDTIEITVPPGTYIIERRFEYGIVDTTTISMLKPYGSTYSEQFYASVASAMRESIMADDSVAVIMSLLNANNLDSLYQYLGVTNLVELPDTSITIYTSCCEITIPILDPDCGFNPCKNGTPDFEEYLFDKWDATLFNDTKDLNNYFKFDGTNGIWPAGPNKPAAPFNTPS